MRGFVSIVYFSLTAIYLLSLTYLGQRLVVPVTVADDYDPSLGFLTAVLPTTGFLLAYQLILKPRRRKERAA